MSRGVAVCAVLCALVASGWAAGQAAEPYRIGGGDVLQVNVWKNVDLSHQVTVRPDGMITLPLVRDVAASGRTAMELGEQVAERLAAFVNAPNVTVTVVTPASSRVATYGAVTSGMFPLPGPTNAVQLLALAGGPTPEADLARSYILRGSEILPVDLVPRPAGEDPGTAKRELRSGDVLVVPFRAAADRILVAGEVRAPRTLSFKEGLTVLDAFVEAGGGTDYSDLDATRVVRRAPGGKREELRIDLARMLQRADLSGNILLAPGDIVVVPR